MFLEIKNLTFAYKKNTTPILKNFSFSMEKQEIVSIMGASGCGKSTLLRLIAGLEEPQSGTIIMEGRCLFSDKENIEPYKRNIGMVFQDYALFPHLKVKENIAYGLNHLSKDEKEKRVNEFLNLIEMEEHQNKYPHELSGGQQQRVALARSLACHPKLLLLDEPFSNLDAHLKNQIREDVKKILKKTQATCLIVSHDEEDGKALGAREVRL